MQLKRVFLCVLSLCLLLGMTACQPTQEETPEILDLPEDLYELPVQSRAPQQTALRDQVFSLNYHPEYSLNPFTCESETNRLLCSLLFEPMVQVTPRYTAEPGVFASWSHDGGLTFTFELAEGLQFSDGSSITFWDVLYSLNRAMESGSVYSGRLQCIKSAGQENGRIVIQLKEANPGFPLLLDIPVVKEGSAYQDLPIGSGRYGYREEEDYRCLQVNDLHPLASEMPVNRFYLLSYEQDEVNAAFDEALLDLLTADLGAAAVLHPTGDTERRLATGSVLSYLGLNTRREVFADPARRRLLWSAVDRSGAAGANGGEAALLPVSPACPWYDAELGESFLIRDLDAYCISILTEDYDRDGLLEYIRSGEVTDFTLDFVVCSENPASVSAAKVISQSLLDLGIDNELRLLGSDAFYQALSSRDYDLFYASVRLTADFDLSALLCSGGSACFTPQDDALEQYVRRFRESDGEEKIVCASDLFTYLAQNCSIIPLSFGRKAVFTHRGTVQNMDPAWADPFFGLENWEIRLD